MLKIQDQQNMQLERSALERQTREIGQRFAQEIEKQDPELAARVSVYSKGPDVSLLDNILKLTGVEQYQKILLFVCLETGIDIFERSEFHYILNHPFLSGDAKARHLAVSSFTILHLRR